jgi:3-hydroxyacyl-CoA dehydrogenase/enoyl-CoA hydratase/3-hydroxybutyryl-CoA epimerase
VKKQVFQTLDQVTSGDAILASNTSSLSVTRMATATQRPGKVAGLHFFNPVHRMELVEVVRAAETDDETIARLVSLVRALGKTPIVTSDSPGFLVNRVLFPYLGEAVLMVGEAGCSRGA